MDAGGGRTIATRDEHYNLVSALYHTLQGADTCNTYALDAEAAGDERLAAFFKEGRVAQVQLAERAKELLGILEVPPAPEVSPDIPPEGGISPGEDVASAAGVVPEEAPSEAPRAATGRIVPEDLDPTISVLRAGVVQLTIARAVAEIEAWERKLEASGDPELEPIAGNLGALRGLLWADPIDVAAAGPLLTTLGEQVRRVAASDVGVPIADKLQRLGELLAREGRSISG